MSDVESAEPAETPAHPWRRNLWLFLATVVSVFVTGALSFATPPSAIASQPKDAGLQHAFSQLTATSFLNGAKFAGTLLTILVAHELGHYIAARIHKVEASLPFFIPLPILSPFGTMGAVIRMRGTIPTRRALLDIGASGPLAGMAFAIPLYAWGVAHSELIPATTENITQLGESLLTKVLDRSFGPVTPEGMDIIYSPVAFGAWGGMFVTMINLIPVGQLDGGHVAYALFGPKQDRYAQNIHRAMLVFFFMIVAGHLVRDIHVGFGVLRLHQHLASATPWLVWFQLLAVLGTLAAHGRGATPKPGTLTIRTRVVATIGLVVLASLAREHKSWAIVGGFFVGLALFIAMEVKGGVLRRHDLLDHPSTGAEPLDARRKAVAILTLLVFALLFMPEPFSM
jgi:membrane-associated protease RseP (regulator of RpoE activity)